MRQKTLMEFRPLPAALLALGLCGAWLPGQAADADTAGGYRPAEIAGEPAPSASPASAEKPGGPAIAESGQDDATAPSPLRQATLPLASERYIRSEHTGQRYRIQTTTTGRRPAGGYPVLYVLDGDAQFPMVATAAHGMALNGREHGVVPMLIVGVGYGEHAMLHRKARTLDYTPPAADLPDTGDRGGRPQGGADRFLRFLTEELRPAIAREFRVDAGQQSLYGHSYGGLFVLHALFRQPDAFRNYLASSPSIWWNKGYIRGAAERFVQTHGKPGSALLSGPDAQTSLPVRLHITVGEHEQNPSPRLDPQSRRAKMQRQRALDYPASGVFRILESKVQGLQVGFTEYPAATHATSAMFSALDAPAFASGSVEMPAREAGRPHNPGDQKR